MNAKRWMMWKRLSLALLTGSVLLQAPACGDFAAAIVTISSAVTAGGVVYLVARVMS